MSRVICNDYVRCFKLLILNDKSKVSTAIVDCTQKLFINIELVSQVQILSERVWERHEFVSFVPYYGLNSRAD